MKVLDMMKVSEENSGKYVYQIDGRTIKLDKDMVDTYSRLICPMTEEYISCLLDQFGKKYPKDSVLSCTIALGMTKELSGYEYAM